VLEFVSYPPLRVLSPLHSEREFVTLWHDSSATDPVGRAFTLERFEVSTHGHLVDAELEGDLGQREYTVAREQVE
jgi:hypothetical protein